MKITLPTSFLIFPFVIITSCNNSSSSESYSNPPQGEIASEFASAPVATEPPKPQPPVQTEEERLRAEGWKMMSLSNGSMPDCFNYTPRVGETSNSLDVTVGGSTDVVIKVMSLTEGRCIRFVFINGGNTYSIRNLPEDRYNLKIAYGKNWISKNENAKCLGKFMSNALYEEGDDVLDFNKQLNMDGYSVPSFSLRLDVVAGTNNFNSSGISEETFNK